MEYAVPDWQKPYQSSGITGVMVAYNLNKIAYPWNEAIASVLPVVDELIVVDCGSTDGTRYDLTRWQTMTSKITIIDGEWSDKSEIISIMTNVAIRQVRTDYHLCIQGDEVIHENSYNELRWIAAHPDIQAASVMYTHFVSDFDTTFPFMYSRAIRMARTDSDWHSVGDGVQYDKTPLGRVYQSRVQFYHYGKVHLGREHEAAVKEHEFQQMFVHLGLGFPDPLVEEAYHDGVIDYNRIFAEARKRGEFKPFTGTHPSCMAGYIARGRAAAERARPNQITNPAA